MISASASTGWAERTADLHAASMPQKDNLCGAFWGALALTAAGYQHIDQDLVALESGTLLPDGPPHPPLPGVEPVIDYRLELGVAPEAQSGTAAAPLARAIVRLSRAELEVVPVSGPWTAERVCALIELDPLVALIANIDTGRLWGSSATDAQCRAQLERGADDGPPPDWSVGHFANPVAVERGPAGAIVTVRDTYPALGGGTHRQPAARLAAALERGDGREGGVLVIAPAARAGDLQRRLADDGFRIAFWDNGTPDIV
jgi:hypothetical protein